METIAVTGGNGTIGAATLTHLAEEGYRTVNLSRGPRKESVADEYKQVDLLEAGEVYGALARSDADAVIHMGTIPEPLTHPGYVTFRSNVLSSYHVLEAGHELGLEAVSLASSINAMGAVFQDAPIEVEYLPVDEAHPVAPRDPYGLAKHVIEITADGFGRLEDAPRITTLRYPWVCTEADFHDRFPDPDRGVESISERERKTLLTYLYLEDAASVARRAVEADIDGHERFWAVATDTTAPVPTNDVVNRLYSDADRRRDFDGTESLVSTEKARRLLDWHPEHSWRDS